MTYDACNATQLGDTSGVERLGNGLGGLNLGTGPVAFIPSNSVPPNFEEQVVRHLQSREKAAFRTAVKDEQRELERAERIDAAIRGRLRELLEFEYTTAKNSIDLQERLAKAELEEERMWLAEDIADAEKRMEERHSLQLEQVRERER